MTTPHQITSCLWFDNQAEDAAQFYTSAFDNAEITTTTYYSKESSGPSGKPEGSVMTVSFEIENFSFLALNGGPVFKPNPSISFFVNADSKEEVDALWGKLIKGGKALMPLDKYPFAAHYGWVEDKFGISWQLIFGDKPEGDWRPKVMPSFLFTKENIGKGREAIAFYTHVFKDSKTGLLAAYPEDTATAKEGDLAYGDFQIKNTWIAAMDSGTEQPFSFNEGISIMVHCEDQKEIDDYWRQLSAIPQAEQCGWLKDRFGVSWQIIPKNLNELLKTKEAVQAMMQMKKLDIKVLEQAGK